MTLEELNAKIDAENAERAKAVDDGGPAFPISSSTGDPRDGVYCRGGMSLRDYFAAKAMASLMQNVEYGATLQRLFDPTGSIAQAGPDKESPQSYLVRLAYTFADAMLAERAKKRPAND